MFILLYLIEKTVPMQHFAFGKVWFVHRVSKIYIIFLRVDYKLAEMSLQFLNLEKKLDSDFFYWVM